MLIKRLGISKRATSPIIHSVTPYNDSEMKHKFHVQRSVTLQNSRKFLQKALGANRMLTPYRKIISTAQHSQNSSFSITTHNSKGFMCHFLRWPQASFPINNKHRKSQSDNRDNPIYWKQYSQKWSQIISSICTEKSQSILKLNSSHVAPIFNCAPIQTNTHFHRRSSSVRYSKITPTALISSNNSKTIFTNELIEKKVAVKQSMRTGETQTGHTKVSLHCLPLHKITIKINHKELG
jgi:hypothetical protein